MATVKDVANAAGVSITTVSIVLNGHAAEKHIPQTTVDKVLDAARELNYKNNNQGRRNSPQNIQRPTVIFMWPQDYRPRLLGTYVSTIAKVSKDLDFDCNIAVLCFEPGNIASILPRVENLTFGGIIMGAMSAKDLSYIEGINLKCPVVVINRNSNKYSTVGVNNTKISTKIAKMLLDNRCHEIAFMEVQNSFHSMSLRTRTLEYTCDELGIDNSHDWNVIEENTLAGGARAAEKFLSLSYHPNVLYCESDIMAIGAVHRFAEKGVKIPEEIKVICFSSREQDALEYATIPLTGIVIPTQDIIHDTLTIIQNHLEGLETEPVHKELEITVLPGKTFPVK